MSYSAPFMPNRGRLAPWALDYCLRLRAERERSTREFNERKHCAIARLAVDEQEIGE